MLEVQRNPTDPSPRFRARRTAANNAAVAPGQFACPDIMRLTLNIDDTLLARAARLTGVREKNSLVQMGLEALIARCSAARLSKLGGTERKLRPIRRRRDR